MADVNLALAQRRRIRRYPAFGGAGPLKLTGEIEMTCFGDGIHEGATRASTWPRSEAAGHLPRENNQYGRSMPVKRGWRLPILRTVRWAMASRARLSTEWTPAVYETEARSTTLAGTYPCSSTW
jgi:hypothetical protein